MNRFEIEVTGDETMDELATKLVPVEEIMMSEKGAVLQSRNLFAQGIAHVISQEGGNIIITPDWNLEATYQQPLPAVALAS